MELIAAIDLLGGHAVRLRHGDYTRPIATADPVDLAERWAAAGAHGLHIVDLEGARSGRPRQLPILAAVVSAARAAAPEIRVQAGGGLRSDDAVAAVFDAGADAAILGTAALERPGFLAGCAVRWPSRIVVALDLRDGRPAAGGWLRDAAGAGEATPVATARRLLDDGAAGLIVTDIGRDGALGGPNLELLATFRSAIPEARLVASGGVRSTVDLLALRDAGLDAAIVGLALLTGDISVEAAVSALEGVAA